jgi:hypothetical protein
MDGASYQPRLVKRGAASRMKQFTTHTLRRLASGIRLAAAPSKDTLIGSDDNDNDNDRSISLDSETDSQRESHEESGVSGTSSNSRVKKSLGLADSWDSVTELDRNNTFREARGSKEFYRAYTHFLGGSLAPKEKQQQPGRETFTGTKMSPRSTATEEQHDDDWATYPVARSSSLESSRHLVEQFVRHTTHDEPVHTTRRRSISKCQNSMLMMTHPMVLDVPQHEDLLTTCQSSFPPSTVRVSMDSLRQVPETCWSERIGMDRNAIITKTVKQKWRLALAAITSRSERSSEEERESASSSRASPTKASPQQATSDLREQRLSQHYNMLQRSLASTTEQQQAAASAAPLN